MKISELFLRSIIGAALSLSCSLASATIMVTTGVDNTGTDNVIANNACDSLIGGPALTVQGCLNTSHSTLVNFTSDENIIYDGGQAKIVSQDGDGFSFLQIALADPDFTFSKLLLNIEAPASPTGSVTFTGLPGGSTTLALDPNGQNHFIITGEDFKNVSFQTYGVTMLSIDLAADVKQVRIGGIDSTSPDNPPPPPPVPEPGILGLVGLALVMLGGLRRRSV